MRHRCSNGRSGRRGSPLMLGRVTPADSADSGPRRVAVLTHLGRPEAVATATRLIEGLSAAGITCSVPADDFDVLGLQAVRDRRPTHAAERHRGHRGVRADDRARWRRDDPAGGGMGAGLRHPAARREPRPRGLPRRGRILRDRQHRPSRGRLQLHASRSGSPSTSPCARATMSSGPPSRSTRCPSTRPRGNGCSSCWSRSTGDRCPAGPVTVCCCPPRPGRPRTRSRPAAR